MDFTFGIITTGNKERIDRIIRSIENENIPNYEIIIIGGELIEGKNIKHIFFDETIKTMWITRKKNLITQNAKYENIVYMHDYVYLLDGWYEGHLKYGDNFNILMDRVINIDDTRFRDWTLWAELDNDFSYIMNNRQFLLPYDMTHLSKYMYISGAYWVAKKSVMFEFPLDETLSWGESEDVEWSKQIRQKYDFHMNIDSSVKFLKKKDICGFYKTDNHSIEFLKRK